MSYKIKLRFGWAALFLQSQKNKTSTLDRGQYIHQRNNKSAYCIQGLKNKKVILGSGHFIPYKNSSVKLLGSPQRFYLLVHAYVIAV